MKQNNLMLNTECVYWGNILNYWSHDHSLNVESGRILCIYIDDSKV